VALIRKTKPEWQAGHLNGIGGMIEDFDHKRSASCSGLEAMVREFTEETGFETQVEDWKSFHTLGAEKWNVECYKAFNIPLEQLKSTTDEEVVITYVDQLPGSVLFNLRWLIPLALDCQPLPTMQVYR
jgi:8-oxo-dGTP diphosphatase